MPAKSARKLSTSNPGTPEMNTLTLLKDDMFAEAGRKVLLHHLHSMKTFEYSATEGSNPEGVHQMRVAIRKFRSTYMVFRDSFPRRYESVILKPMKRTAKVLGDVRDMDVQLMQVGGHIATYPQHNEGLAPLTKRLTSMRNRARRALMLWMDSQTYARFIHNAFALLSEPLTPQTVLDRHARRPVADAVPAIIYRRISDVDEIGHDTANVSTDDLHELRIRGKRLRYTIESFESLLGPGIKDMLRALKDMQDILGDFNDATIMLNIVHGLNLGEKEELPAWRVYRTALHDAIANAEEAFPRAYQKLFSRRNKKALARAIGEL